MAFIECEPLNYLFHLIFCVMAFFFFLSFKKKKKKNSVMFINVLVLA